MALVFKQEYATVPLGRQFAKVVEEPCLKETRFRGQPDYILHFLARGRNGELIKCTGTHERALKACREMNVNDTVIVDVSVKITAIQDTLEYAYEGFFICIDPRQ